MGFLSTLLLGLVVGVVARFLLPGRQRMGIIMTILLGLAGSFSAGMVGQYFGWYRMGEGAGFVGSVIGAIVLLVIYGKLRQG